jgi:hypothetical protein
MLQSQVHEAPEQAGLVNGRACPAAAHHLSQVRGADMTADLDDLGPLDS